jgi:hypothetical protein
LGYPFFPDIGLGKTRKKIALNIKFYLTNSNFGYINYPKWEKVVKGGMVFEMRGMKRCSGAGMSMP